MKRALLTTLIVFFAATAAAGRSSALAEEGAAPDGAQQEVEARLARAELLAGLTPVQGPGVIVYLRNSRLAPKGVDPKALQVGEQDFNAILNVLRAAGAEALAIGGNNAAELERVQIGTAAREGWNSLIVNGTALQPPYRILAIGDAFKMRTDLLKEGGVVKKSGLDVLQMIQVEHAANLSLPAARVAGEFRFARAGSGETILARAPAPEPVALPESKPEVKPAPEPEPAPKPAVTRSSPAEEPRIAAIVRRPPASFAPSAPRTLQAPAPKPLQPQVKMPETPRPVEVKPRVVKTTKPVRMAAAVSPARGAFFGGRGLAKFHAAGCRYGERIQPEQRVLFANPKEAAQKGRTACPVCQAP